MSCEPEGFTRAGYIAADGNCGVRCIVRECLGDEARYKVVRKWIVDEANLISNEEFTNDVGKNKKEYIGYMKRNGSLVDSIALKLLADRLGIAIAVV